MLIPYKHMELNSSVIKVSSVIIHILNNQKILSFDKLMDKVIKDSQLICKRDVFINSINFLYLMGVLDYALKTDSFFIIKRAINENNKDIL